MAKSSEAQPPVPSSFQRFEALTKKLLSVPKKEVDEKEKERPKRSRRSSK